MKKKFLSVVCAVVLSISLTSCSLADTLGKLSGNAATWVDSDLIGAIPEDKEIRVQDDFAAAVNQEWKKETGDNYRNLFHDVTEKVISNKQEIVTDESISGETADRVRTYYKLASDWDDRASDGVNPLKPYIDDIKSISSMDEMYDYFADTKRNPLHIAPIFVGIDTVIHSEKYKDNYALAIAMPMLSLTENGSNRNYYNMDSSTSFEKYLDLCEKSEYILGRLGYTKEEADDIVHKCVKWEKKVANTENTGESDDDKDMTFTHEEAVALTGSFPMEEIISGWGFKDTKYILIDPQYAKKISGLCKESNLEDIKAYLIISYAMEASIYLDRDAYDKMQEIDLPRAGDLPADDGKTPEQIENELIFDKYIGRTPMVGAMNQVYVENFFDESTVGDLTGITEDVIDGFRDIFSDEPWLSKEGKKACIEKLDAIKIHIAYQDFDTVDYSKLQLKPHEEGGSFLEAYFESKRLELDHLAWLSNKKYERDYWDPMNQGLSTTVTNAMYMPESNGIYILAGILADPVYTKDMSYEEKLANLFIIVGHEITHGFDKNGSQYDKDGNKKPILSEDDLKEFNDRNDDVAAYYTTLTPFSGSGLLDGNKVNAEATADMGGIKVTLLLAKQKEDFDYDLYFRSFARLWRVNITVDAEKDNVKADMHPLAFHRVNVGLQQFDEFYDTYDIKESDGMYVAPEKRIKVW